MTTVCSGVLTIMKLFLKKHYNKINNHFVAHNAEITQHLSIGLWQLDNKNLQTDTVIVL